jgi:hypothetical protein
MKSAVASFALATLSLLTSYGIVAAWPDKDIADLPAVAEVAPADDAAALTVVSLAD